MSDKKNSARGLLQALSLVSDDEQRVAVIEGAFETLLAGRRSVPTKSSPHTSLVLKHLKTTLKEKHREQLVNAHHESVMTLEWVSARLGAIEEKVRADAAVQAVEELREYATTLEDTVQSLENAVGALEK